MTKVGITALTKLKHEKLFAVAKRLGSQSALGRALRWAFAGSKGPSAAEMSKVARGVTPKQNRDWIAESEALTDVDELRLLWREAKTAKASDAILEKVKTRAERLEGATGVGEGTDAGVPASGGKKPTKRG